MKDTLTVVPIARAIARPAFAVAERRILPFVEQYLRGQRWPRRQQTEPFAMNIVDLCRAVYLQGLWDGVQISPRLEDIPKESYIAGGRG